jgi:hypothetical protein
MKKVILAFAFVGALTLSIAGNGEGENTKIETVNYKGGKLTIKNDLGKAVRVHTGFGETTMTKGASTTVTCSPGKSVKVEGKVVFKVTSDMCGTTVNLSDHM